MTRYTQVLTYTYTNVYNVPFLFLCSPVDFLQIELTLSMHKRFYTLIYTYVLGVFNKFPDFFVQEFKIVVDSCKFTILLLYILWDDWPMFMISGSNEQLQQELEYSLLKPDCYSWWISKMQSGREDTLED